MMEPGLFVRISIHGFVLTL